MVTKVIPTIRTDSGWYQKPFADGSMAEEVQADLAKQSEREEKGVDWARYQAVCDELESAEYEIESLKAKVAELESGYIIDPSKDDIRLSGTLNKIKADAIRSAKPWVDNCSADNLEEVARKIEAGTL